MKQLLLICPKPICLLLILAFPLLATNANAQDGKVLVEVTDENDNPLWGVNVFTDNFKFSSTKAQYMQIDLFSLKPESKINFSYLGYQSQCLKVTELNRLDFTIRLLPEEKLLLPVYVVGRRDDQAAHIPYVVEQIDREEIKFTQAQHAADALQNNANIFVQKSQMGGGSPIIRGFEANRVLLVVDGVRLNNAIYRSGHLQNAITIDQSILQQIEVINGPGSLIYGSDALGGVVHFRTKDPRLKIGEKFKDQALLLSGDFYTRYSSANNEKTVHFDFNIGGERWASLTSVSYSDFGNLRTGNNRPEAYPDFGKHLYSIERINNRDYLIANPNPNIQNNTGYHQMDLIQKIRFQPNEQVYFIANFQYSNSSEIPRYDQLTERKGQSLKFAEWYYGPQTRSLFSLKTRLLGATPLYDNATIIGAYQRIAEDRHERKTDSNWRESSLVDVSVFSLTADFDKQPGQNKSHNLSYGFDFSHNIIESEAFQMDIIENTTQYDVNNRYPSGGSRMSNAGAYFNYRWIDPSERLIYNGGVRYSYSNLFGKFSATDPIQWPTNFLDGVAADNQAFTWATGLTYNSFNQWQFRILSATAFRAPNIDDFAKFREKNGFVLTPNPELKPEQAFTNEITIAKTFGRIQTVGAQNTGTTLKLSATAFYTRLKNAIVRQNSRLPDGSPFFISNGDTLFVQANVNSDSAYIYGLSANVLFSLADKLTLKSSLNYTRGRRAFNDPEQSITDLMVPQDHIPPLYGQTSLVYETGRFKLSAYLRYQGRKKVEDYAVSAVEIGPDGAYIFEREGSSDNIENGLVDANGDYQGTYAWTTINFYGAYQFNKNLSLNLSIENIADLHYRHFASGLSAPGRNLILALRGSF